MHPLVVEQLRANVAAAVRQAKAAATLEHAPSKGTFREIAVRELFRPLLRVGLDITTGVLVDSHGNTSPQLDVIIYSSKVVPLVMANEAIACVPIEAALQVVEVKSMMTREEAKKCVASALKVSRMVVTPPSGLTFAPEAEPGKNWLSIPTIYSVFAFATGLASGGKDEWARLDEVRAEELSAADRTRVLIHDLCVRGSGYWARPSLPGGETVAADDDYNEVLAMLVRGSDSWPTWESMRGSVPIRPYVR